MAATAGAGGGVEAAGFLGFSALSKCGKKGAPKRKRVNRNIKKNWKRHSDVRDVEEFLEDVRLQERTAGGLLAEKRNESLFFVDTGNTKKKDIKVNRRPDIKIHRRSKPLRIDLILRSDSKVPVPKDVSSHQVPNGRKLKRKRERLEKLEKKGILTRSERLLQAQLSQTKRPKEEPNNKPSRGFYDLWGVSCPFDSVLEGKDPWFLEQTKKSRVKRPGRLNEKPSQLPAVEVAAPGASYNPTFESHQALLLQAHEVEVKKLKEEERLERQLKFPTVDEAPTEESRLRELCEGLVEESDEENTAGDGETGGRSVAFPQRARKTERQRKKEKEARVMKVKREAEKAAKLRRQNLFQLRSIHATLKARQAELLKRKQLREEKNKLKALQPRRLGRVKYKEPDIDVLLSEELSDSLRKLKPEGSLAKDRFKSFQKRNLIEPRERAKFKRKLKVKYVEKRAFREVTL